MGENAGARRYFFTALRLSHVRDQGRIQEPTQATCFLCAEGIGTSLFAEGSVLEALHFLELSLRIDDSRLTIHQNVASALGKLAVDKDSRFLERAVEAYSRVLQIDPGNVDACCKILFLRQQLCDWREFEQDFLRVRRTVLAQIAGKSRLSIVPFNALTLPFSMEELLAINLAHAVPARPSFQFAVETFLEVELRRIRIGFVSADLRDHPVGRDLFAMFSALQSETNMEVFAYAINQEHSQKAATSSSAKMEDLNWRNKIASSVHRLQSISDLEEESAAQTIVRDKIHILVDMMGYTRGNRKGVFAFQPAPVQVAFKGYMSTSGAKHFHLISDRVATPPEFASQYSERLSLISGLGCFISGHAVNHNNLLLPTKQDEQVKRTLVELGVPMSGIVMCCFNGLYKLDANVWTLWMHILQRARGNTTLWLLNDPKEAQNHLCREASVRGVSCTDQILFSDRVPFEIHIQVKSRCDVALDTPVYNSHGTAADIMWAGVPLITLPESTMAARVAASILMACNLSEFITRSPQEYVNLVHHLHSSQSLLRKSSEKVHRLRPTWPLHDLRRWARNFQLASRNLLNLFFAGESERDWNVINF